MIALTILVLVLAGVLYWRLRVLSARVEGFMVTRYKQAKSHVTSAERTRLEAEKLLARTQTLSTQTHNLMAHPSVVRLLDHQVPKRGDS